MIVGRWWWVVDPWVAMVCWCDCRGVIFAVVWWFACSVSEKRETKRESEKDRDDVAVYDEYFIVMFTLFYCVER